jgi:ferredoxin
MQGTVRFVASTMPACAELLPELLALDEWGFPISLTGERDPMLSTALVDHGRRAVRACH